MIDLDFIERLIKALDESGIDTLELERGGTKVRLAKTPSGGVLTTSAGPGASPATNSAPAPNPQPAASAGATSETGATQASPPAEPRGDLREITSPMVGTFYRGPAPDAGPYVKEGARVEVGDPVCIIEAMKLMNELEAEFAGTVVEVCVENATPVEFGQVLFRLEPR